MINPFLKRATEYLRDEEAFLSIVSPEPVSYFLASHGMSGALYDRLVMIRGTPGSGKTTLAKLFEYPALIALLRNTNIDAYQPLVAALTDAGGLADAQPRVLGCRLALETDYRDFWEFPYPDELKTGLLTALVQARSVLGWLRNLVAAGHSLDDVCVVPRPDAEAATYAIGGTDANAVMTKARAVEASIYNTVSALVAPEIGDLDAEAVGAYRPFDVIDRVRVKRGGEAESYADLLPLVVLDDAHTLHPQQFRALQHWLIRRELRVARWVLSRLDVLHPGEVLATVTEDRLERPEMPGVGARREITEILLQSSDGDRKANRMTFRKMAKDMADRYLRLMPLFSARRLTSMSNLLSTNPEPISQAKYRDLESSVEGAAREFKLSESRLTLLRVAVDEYRPAGKVISEDLRLAMLRILIHRYVKRTAKERGLFDTDETVDPEPARPPTADVSVYDGARLYLLHKHDRPYYSGIDDLCDAGSENAEQFLKLAAALVEAAAARLTRNKPPSLTAREQNKLLRQAATDYLTRWNFPQSRLVEHLTRRMAQRCLEESLADNAALGAGANAFGIPNSDLEEMPAKHSELARVLQFAIAYNVITLVPRYSCKGKVWCLLELCGIPALNYGLTLKRGGFVESSAAEVAALLGGVEE